MRHSISRRYVILCCVSVLLVLFPLFSASAGTKMPSFSLQDVVTGDIVESKTFQGKALLVTFFATWCPPCMQEVPELIILQNKFAKKGFSVVGLSVDQGGAGVVKRLVEKRSINYPVLLADGNVARGFNFDGGLPSSFLIDKKGLVVKKYPGYVPRMIMENDIKKIMN